MASFAFVFTLITHLTGGSVGREGTAVQIGGTLANRIAVLFKMNEKTKRIFIMSGISAGFGAVFGTPLAGAFFGMEVCVIGRFGYDALLPLISSYAAHYVTCLFGITEATHSIKSLPEINLYTIAVIINASLAFESRDGFCRFGT